MNDEDTQRAYDSRDDAYRIFRRMLESGHPPDDWDGLIAEASSKQFEAVEPAPPAAP